MRRVGVPSISTFGPDMIACVLALVLFSRVVAQLCVAAGLALGCWLLFACRLARVGCLRVWFGFWRPPTHLRRNTVRRGGALIGGAAAH